MNTEQPNIKHIISLGAGVQSSTLALMAAAGEIGPTPDAAIFADTQAEPASVYKWLDWLEKQLPFPVYRVTAGSLQEQTLQMRTTKDGRKYAKTNIPFFTRNADGSIGKIPFRNCTIDFKIKPIRKLQRQIGEIRRGQKTVGVSTWIGISTDEAQRMKDSRDLWCINRWPLIEKGMSRADCIAWMKANGFPEPPRSSCVFCPFHSSEEWHRLKTEEPAEFARAVQFERDLQAAKQNSVNFASVPFLSRAALPLDSLDFSTSKRIPDQFGNECEGVCGV